MREIKNVLICGLGAIGSVYADTINQFSHENLRILVDRERMERYTKNPKIFNGKELWLNYILPDSKDFKADLVIISTKYDGFFDSVENIKNFITDETIIISLLNGITTEEILAERYGWKNILHSYYIGGSAVRNGNNVNCSVIGKIVFGIADKIHTNINNITLLKNYFEKIGIKYEISDDIKRSMWLKYMFNVSYNQLSAILNLNFRQMNTPKCKKILIDIMREVQAIAKAEGINNTETMIEEALQYFSIMTPEGKTSMLQDVEAKRKTEVELFSKTIINLGEKYSIPTPVNRVFAYMLDIIEDNYI